MTQIHSVPRHSYGLYRLTHGGLTIKSAFLIIHVFDIEISELEQKKVVKIRFAFQRDAFKLSQMLSLKDHASNAVLTP